MKLTKTELKEMIKTEMKSLKEGLNPDVAKHMVGIHKGFVKVENDGVMVYDSPTTAKKASDYLNSKKIAASSDGKYLYIESFLNERLNLDVVKHMMVIYKGFIKVEDDGTMIYDSPANAKKAADYLNSKKVAASSDGKYLYIESVNKVSPKRKTTVTESFMEKTSRIFYKKTKELVKNRELSADVAKVLERLFQDAVSAAFSEGARSGFRR
jgi:hypothetical protein